MTRVFAYGTLRPGMALAASWGTDQMVATPSVAQGKMWNVLKDDPLFPVVSFGRDGIVHGDILEWTNTRELAQLIDMEARAGYTLEIIEALVPDGVVQALAFHWPHAEVGLHIPSGDWKKFTDERPLGSHTLACH
jgi:gamma-glutamylcyclotransferase (GGCT)/AIG2-like uncharacterized protein YtfP